MSLLQLPEVQRKLDLLAPVFEIKRDAEKAHELVIPTSRGGEESRSSLVSRARFLASLGMTPIGSVFRHWKPCPDTTTEENESGHTGVKKFVTFVQICPDQSAKKWRRATIRTNHANLQKLNWLHRLKRLKSGEGSGANRQVMESPTLGSCEPATTRRSATESPALRCRG